MLSESESQKRLHDILKDQIPASKGPVHAVRGDGVVTFQWKPLARVEIQDDRSSCREMEPSDELGEAGVRVKLLPWLALDTRPTLEDDEVEWEL